MSLPSLGKGMRDRSEKRRATHISDDSRQMLDLGSRAEGGRFCEATLHAQCQCGQPFRDGGIDVQRG